MGDVQKGSIMGASSVGASITSTAQLLSVLRTTVFTIVAWQHFISKETKGVKTESE